ncbi:TatD family hydrolase [Thalassotalea sp. 1_MG-2023]|uniref:TatD family hydrolase n=1 Tax=Thalassotalea sp. 1_MG-2023 TaxID=3062680 RepID=UPI0026E406BE|nr:TatD family hydrolase [Thalassotalea sp. 1_MG-2023]MDO6428501.1 TatD family hydrolase [Thalassotalea sp. 1_MG-2023]
MLFTDSHCHLDFQPLNEDPTTLFTQCIKSNIHRIIVPAVSPKNWQAVLALKLESSNKFTILPCLGIHPWYLKGLTFQALEQLAAMIEKHQEHLIAIGECGIDGKIAKEQNNLAQQQQFFRQQVLLAKQYHKPLIIHHRRSHNELIEILKQEKPQTGGFLHGFSGSYQQGKTYIDMGFKLGVGGTITYERAEKTRKAVKRFPLDSLVLETDAPAMPLSGEQGQANSPLNIIKIFQQLCKLRSETPEAIATQLERNVNEIVHI